MRQKITKIYQTLLVALLRYDYILSAIAEVCVCVSSTDFSIRLLLFVSALLLRMAIEIFEKIAEIISETTPPKSATSREDCANRALFMGILLLCLFH